ncbi:MAG: hypothetical protein FWC16_07825 [Defluviitaleaceae bacterium]|nr:hypothetical protein [Defluviitaleaceae bacterium]MCL2274823.1 hypothetical protein [Defluviitaleaceae bacterium]
MKPYKSYMDSVTPPPALRDKIKKGLYYSTNTVALSWVAAAVFVFVIFGAGWMFVHADLLRTHYDLGTPHMLAGEAEKCPQITLQPAYLLEYPMIFSAANLWSVTVNIELEAEPLTPAQINSLFPNLPAFVGEPQRGEVHFKDEYVIDRIRVNYPNFSIFVQANPLYAVDVSLYTPTYIHGVRVTAFADVETDRAIGIGGTSLGAIFERDDLRFLLRYTLTDTDILQGETALEEIREAAIRFTQVVTALIYHQYIKGFTK